MPDAPSERRVKRRRGARVIVLARGVSTRAGDFVAGPGSTSVTRGDFVAGPGSTDVARGDFVAGPDSTNVARADFVAGPGSTNVLVLLQGDTDPGFPGSRFWQTPGGGIDPGESPREAAARELYEETGLAVDPDDLGGPVATRTVTHGYSDRILVQHETYFRIEVPRFEPVHAQLSEAEARRRVETAWFPLDDLPPDVWPAQLPSLAVHSGAPVDLGEVEESTLPAW